MGEWGGGGGEGEEGREGRKEEGNERGEEGREEEGEEGRVGEGEVERGGEEEGGGEGQRGVLLTWDSAEVTEITLGRNRTTEDFTSTNSTRETRSSLEEDIDSSRLPSDDITDSEHSVFSPEPLHPFSPLTTKHTLDPLSESDLEQCSPSLTSGLVRTGTSSASGQHSDIMSPDCGEDPSSQGVCVKEYCEGDIGACVQSQVSDAVEQAQKFGHKYGSSSAETSSFRAGSKACVEMAEECTRQKKEDVSDIQTQSPSVDKLCQLSRSDTAQESKQEQEEHAVQREATVCDRVQLLSSPLSQEEGDVRD